MAGNNLACFLSSFSEIGGQLSTTWSLTIESSLSKNSSTLPDLKHDFKLLSNFW